MTLIDPRIQQKISEPTLRERLMHQSWCFANGIIIYAQPTHRYNEVTIVVVDNGEILNGSHIYKQHKLKTKDERWHEVVFKLYTKYYKERNNEKQL